MAEQPTFHLLADDRAQAWLDGHPASRPLVIAYDVHRCCGGGRICRAYVRELRPRDTTDDLAQGVLQDGTSVLIDRRAARRLPRRFGVTARGFGRKKHLDLVLDGEQWGELLYT